MKAHNITSTDCNIFCYFSVTHLLKKNELLTPKLFYMIEKNWHKIMAIIFDQLEEDKRKQ